MPFNIRRDKNKSNEIWNILTSNKRDAPQNKEQILQELREENDRKHLHKIMTLIGVKIDEMFHGFNKSFLFFDQDSD